jgi:hypothetical protein
VQEKGKAEGPLPFFIFGEGDGTATCTARHQQPFWNVDFSIKKTVIFTERVSADFWGIFTNILNHNQLFDPTMLGKRQV